MPNNWLSRSVLPWMSVVQNCEIWITVLLSTFRLLLTYFLFWISLHVWCVYYWKNYCIGYLYTQTSQIDCFCCSLKFCYKSGQAILKRYTYYGSLVTVAEKICIINLQNHHCCILKPICTAFFSLYNWYR